MLSGSRQVGGMGGVGSIPISEMVAYLEMFGIDDLLGLDDHDMRRGFVQAMQAMDQVFLEHYRQQEQKEKTLAQRKVKR